MIDFRPVGWERLEADWWPAIADVMPRPWPREAVLMDLRWWRGQETATGRRLMPGRPALQQRWGWKDWDARLILREEAVWNDPRRASQKSSSDSPAVLQSSSSDSPATATENASNQKESSSDSPAVLQSSSSDSPRARSLFTNSPITDHGEKGEGEHAPPPPAATVVRGNQATVVIPAPEVEPSPLVAVLMNAGMPGGYAATVANKLLDAGIRTPTDAVAMALDEWDLGRIVGAARKGKTIQAFREAGWKPPKERGQADRGGHPRPVVITEDGSRIEPTGPPRPLSKSEAQIEALQKLKREGGWDGQRIGNH